MVMVMVVMVITITVDYCTILQILPQKNTAILSQVSASVRPSAGVT